MTSIIKGAFHVVGSIIGFTVGLAGSTIKFTLYGLGAAAIVGICTKPEDKSFSNFFDQWLKNNINKSATEDHNVNPAAAKLMAWGGANVASMISNKYTTDWGVCRVGTVNFQGQQKLHFVGAGNGWYYVGESK